LLAACSSSSTSTGLANAAEAPVLVSIQPANATAGVDANAPVVLQFNHAMMAGMEMLVVVHEGSVSGVAVPVATTWSADRMTLTIKPQATLKHATTYVVHLSPSLKDSAGNMIRMVPGTAMGGTMVSGSMMGASSMMNGQWGPGMAGAGWQAANGTFGMMYTFTTA